MFEKQELAVIHKALTELTIKGGEAPLMAALLLNVQNAHNDINPSINQKNTK